MNLRAHSRAGGAGTRGSPRLLGRLECGRAAAGALALTIIFFAIGWRVAAWTATLFLVLFCISLVQQWRTRG